MNDFQEIEVIDDYYQPFYWSKKQMSANQNGKQPTSRLEILAKTIDAEIVALQAPDAPIAKYQPSRSKFLHSETKANAIAPNTQQKAPDKYAVVDTQTDKMIDQCGKLLIAAGTGTLLVYMGLSIYWSSLRTLQDTLPTAPKVERAVKK